jgi:hypothetical protein
MSKDKTKSPWRTLGSRNVYENPWISVREDTVIRPDGEPGIYGVVHYKNAAVGVLPVEGDHVYLVGQYRYPLERYSWEITRRRLSRKRGTFASGPARAQ